MGFDKILTVTGQTYSRKIDAEITPIRKRYADALGQVDRLKV